MNRGTKRCVIWGTNACGRQMAVEARYLGYEVLAFCSSNVAPGSFTTVDGIPILSPDELKDTLCDVDCIVLGMNRASYIKEVTQMISREFPANIQVLEKSALENDYLNKITKSLPYKWDIDFDTQVADWVDNLMSEVEYWVQEVANPQGEFHWDYEARLNNKDFFGLTAPYQENHLQFTSALPSLEKALKDQAVVMDIGCGLVPLYGSSLPNSQHVNLLTIDPLAPFYNKINEKYSKRPGLRHQFGMFEFMANFFEKNYSDIIIINNALDHCIDPYKSLIECAYVLKTGGKMFLFHRRAEAVNDGYSGLHKWNLDYSDNDFLIWNNENSVNISQQLKSILQVDVIHSDSTMSREDQIVIVEITKVRDFQLNEFIDISKERNRLAAVIEKIMGWAANINLDYLNIQKG